MVFQEMNQLLVEFDNILLNFDITKEYRQMKLNIANDIYLLLVNLTKDHKFTLFVSNIQGNKNLQKPLIAALFIGAIRDPDETLERRISLLNQLLKKLHLEKDELNILLNTPLYHCIGTLPELAIDSNSLELVQLIVEKRDADLDIAINYALDSTERLLEKNYLADIVLNENDISPYRRINSPSYLSEKLTGADRNRLVKLFIESREDRFDENKSFEILAYLVEKYEGLNIVRESINQAVLHLAIKKGHTAIVRSLIREGRYVNTFYNGQRPLEIAVKTGNINIAKSLIDKGAEVNIEGLQYNNKPLIQIATLKNDLPMVRLLIESGAEVNYRDVDGITSLHRAAFKSYVNIARFLIKNGADVNSKDRDNSTPLHIAVSFGMIDVVQCLIDNRANINDRDNFYRSPISIAIVQNQIEVVNLIRQRPDINYTNRERECFIRLCVKKQCEELLRIFIEEHKININGIYEEGTLLHIAAKSGYVGIAKILIENGANMEVENIDRLTPLGVAALQDHTEMVKFLVASGASVENIKGSKLNIKELVNTGIFEEDITKFHQSLFTKKRFIKRLLQYIHNNHELDLEIKHQYLNQAYQNFNPWFKRFQTIWNRLKQELEFVGSQMQEKKSLISEEVDSQNNIPSKPKENYYQFCVNEEGFLQK